MAIFKKYWLFLAFLIAISYGQMLFMYVWKDDNALFFKFYHLDEVVGFFGPGLLGANLYRFLVFPHWVIFSLFGAKHIWPFYLQALLFYIVATISIYKLLAKIFSEKVGRIAGFLFGAGYIASEGFLWLNESIVHSLSIILVCATLNLYAEYAASRKNRFYLLTVFSFFLTLFLTQSRVHYFIALIMLFDILWILKANLSFDGLKRLILRAIPFLTIFYWFYLRSIDTRTKALSDYLINLLSGNFYVLNSLFGTLGNLFVPDALQSNLIKVLHLQLQRSVPIVVTQICIVLLLAGGGWLLAAKNASAKIVISAFLVTGIAWIFIGNMVASSPKVSPSIDGLLSVFLGGISLLLILAYFFLATKQQKRNIFFLVSWLLMSLIGYIGYNPLAIYASTERYLAHSFLAVVGILSLPFAQKKFKIISFFIVLWGILNIVNSIYYQHWILEHRSKPAKEFYQQLNIFMPSLNKGDIVYVNIDPQALFNYEAAFSVGSMPETTAIAWRYGLDRYDFSLVNSFDELTKLLAADPSKLNKIHTFFYSTKGLVATTQFTKAKLGTPNQMIDYQITADKLPTESQLDIPLDQGLASAIPLELQLTLQANPVYQEKIADTNSVFAQNPALRSVALDYQIAKKLELTKATYTTSSEWQDRVTANLHDQDSNSAWEADRILWQKGKEWVQIDLGTPQEVDRLVWINGFSNNSPTQYSIEVSSNGETWKEVEKVDQVVRINADEPQVVMFPTQTTRFIRMVMTKTISDDAPALSELWVVPSKFDQLDIKQTEVFLKNPFSVIADKKSFNQMLEATNKTGLATLYWQINNENNWLTSAQIVLPIIYDGISHDYKLTIPAGGSEITQLRIADIQIPGNIKVVGLKYRPLGLKDVQK